MSYSWFKKGTATATNGSDVVRLQNASIMLSANKPVAGDAFTVNYSSIYETIFIGSDSAGEFIRLDRPFEQATTSNTKYALVRLASGTVNAKIAAIAAAAINQKQISLDDMFEWYTSTADSVSFTGPDGVDIELTTYYFLANAIGSVGGSIESVEAVAREMLSVKSVATNIDEVVAAGSEIAAIKTVNVDMASVKTVALNIQDVNSVGANIQEVKAVGADMPAINTVNANIDKIAAVNANMPAINNVNTKVDYIDLKVTHVDGQALIVDQKTLVATTKASEAEQSALSATQSKSSSAQSETLATASKVAAKLSEDKAKVSEVNAKASEIASEANKVASDSNAASTAADRTSAGLDAASAASAELKAKEWAEKAIDQPVEQGEYSAKHWANIAKTNSDLTFISGGVFTPTAQKEYPTPENPLRDTLFLVGFDSAADSFTFTSGDLAGRTVFNTDQILWDVPSDTFVHVPSPTGAAILSVNGKSGSTVNIASQDIPHQSGTVFSALNDKVSKSDVATTVAPGVTTLSNSYAGTLQSKATTEKALSDGLATKAAASHNHTADSISSGVFSNDRLSKASKTQQGIVQLSSLINGQSEAKAVTEKALSDGLASPSGMSITYESGNVSITTETLPLGSKVTNYTYNNGNLVSSTEVYLGLTKTTTYSYDVNGNLEGVTTV